MSCAALIWLAVGCPEVGVIKVGESISIFVVLLISLMAGDTLSGVDQNLT